MLRAEMEKVKTQLGFKGTLEQFLVSLKQTKKQCLIKRQKK